MTSGIKVFLLEPEPSYPQQLIFAENAEDARNYSVLPASTKMRLINNDPYLNAKCREISIKILDDNHLLPSGALHCRYNDKEYYLTKNLAHPL